MSSHNSSGFSRLGGRGEDDSLEDCNQISGIVGASVGGCLICSALCYVAVKGGFCEDCARCCNCSCTCGSRRSTAGEGTELQDLESQQPRSQPRMAVRGQDARSDPPGQGNQSGESAEGQEHDENPPSYSSARLTSNDVTNRALGRANDEPPPYSQEAESSTG